MSWTSSSAGTAASSPGQHPPLIAGARTGRAEEPDMIVSTAFRVAAMLAAVASVLAFGGCETAPQRPPPSVNITGDWVGTWVFEPAAANVGGGQVAMTLRQ